MKIKALTRVGLLEWSLARSKSQWVPAVVAGVYCQTCYLSHEPWGGCIPTAGGTSFLSHNAEQVIVKLCCQLPELLNCLSSATYNHYFFFKLPFLFEVCRSHRLFPQPHLSFSRTLNPKENDLKMISFIANLLYSLVPIHSPASFLPTEKWYFIHYIVIHTWQLITALYTYTCFLHVWLSVYYPFPPLIMGVTPEWGGSIHLVSSVWGNMHFSLS